MAYRLLPYGLSYRRFKQAREPFGWFAVLALIVVLAVLFVPRMQLSRDPHRVTIRDYEKFMRYYSTQKECRANIQKYLEAKSKGKFDIWKEAAEAEVPAGQALLGLCYFYGVSVPQDKPEGIQWLTKAAIKWLTIPGDPYMEMGEEDIQAEHQ